MPAAFQKIQVVRHEGPKSKNPLAFKHYSPGEIVEGQVLNGKMVVSLRLWSPSQASNSKRAHPFDVFLAYNQEDTDDVIRIAKALKRRHLTPWLDKWNLPPGRCFAEEIEQALPQSRSVAVFVGNKGSAPWERMEINVALEVYAKSHRPLIPILLPSAPKEPPLPPFLRQFKWLRFSDGLESLEALDEMVWAITNVHPSSWAFGLMKTN